MIRRALRGFWFAMAVGAMAAFVAGPAGAEEKEEAKPPVKAKAKKAEKAKAQKGAKKPKAQFTKPPEGAIVLFNGKDTADWTTLDGKPFPWKVENGAMVCLPRKGSIRTKQSFGDQKLHIEFRTPYMPKSFGQARGNSGVYVQGRYEIQVLDSYGLKPIRNNDCGALYSLITPSTNACLPPKQWQSFDITFHAPKFGPDGKMTKKGRLTVVQNGITIINNAEIPDTTPGGIDRNATKPGPLMLQDHGNTVAFRNIWLVPLK
jgi:hypothetical protein